MSKLNLLVFLNSYEDHHPSNDPSRSNFKWDRGINGLLVSNPLSNEFDLAPGASQILFNGSRTLTQDGTTEYSTTQVPLSTQTYQLNWVGGANPTFRTARTTGADATTQVTVTQNGPLLTFSAPAVVGVAAFFTGQVAGMTTSVTITANTVGTIGNSVILTGDGTSSITTLIATWNTDNPSNQITLSSGDGTQIPSSGAIIQLTGGVNSATAFNLVSGGVVIGDNVLIGNEFNTLNQGTFTVIAVTPTSFSVANETGVAEGPILLSSSFASQVQIYSAAGVQIGDTLVISGGFSVVTQGSYKVTAVTANYVQFYTTAVLPVEGPVTTEAIAFYSAAKQLVYLEASQNCTVTVNGSSACQISPFVINNFTKPGIFMNTSTIYSLSVTNNSLNPAKVFLASAE
jgi:hypothetical protein